MVLCKQCTVYHAAHQGIELYQTKLRKGNEEVTMLIQMPCMLFSIDAMR